MILYLLLEIVTQVTIKANLDCRTVDGVMECRIPEPIPTPTPTPTPTPSPTSKLGGGFKTIGGTGGVVCHVTNLLDSGAGSLRACVENQASRLTVVYDVAGTISFTKVLNFRRPYITVDGFSAPAPGIHLKQTNVNQRVLGVIATHNVYIRGHRLSGMFVPGVNGGRNLETFMIDGAGVPIVSPWDDKPITPINRDIYIENNTFLRAEDDISSIWCGANGITLIQNFWYENFHPTTTGCDGWYASDHVKSRHNVSFIRNVYYSNGERQPMIREGCYDCDAVNNVVMDWKNYSGQSNVCGPNQDQNCGPGGGGIVVRDPPNTGLNVIGNVSVSSGYRQNWDCYLGQDPASPLNLRFNGMFFFDNLLLGHTNPEHCRSIPRDQTQFQRNYDLGILSSNSLEGIIDSAGMPYPNSDEILLKDKIKLIYRSLIQ